ncbi:MAG: hypothetical protein E4G90_05680 [Gemmatimonadales bacterium]|nr:MAG: hypothetical protein E4G90_05680 [Gemmatimonadales bacterium]
MLDLAFILTGLYMILISPISWNHFAPFLIFSGLLISAVAYRQEGWKPSWVIPLGLSVLGLLPSHFAMVKTLTSIFEPDSGIDQFFYLLLAKPGAYIALVQLVIVTQLSRRSKGRIENPSAIHAQSQG